MTMQKYCLVITITTYANELVKLFSTFKAPEKEQDFEINIITQTSCGLDLKHWILNQQCWILILYYNDDFKPVDEIIKQRLTKKMIKGSSCCMACRAPVKQLTCVI